MRLPPMVSERTVPPCPSAVGRGETGQLGDRHLGVRRAQRVRGRGPAGAEHHRDVVPVGAGGGGQLLGRRGRVLGGGSYEIGHADRP